MLRYVRGAHSVIEGAERESFRGKSRGEGVSVGVGG